MVAKAFGVEVMVAVFSIEKNFYDGDYVLNKSEHCILLRGVLPSI